MKLRESLRSAFVLVFAAHAGPSMPQSDAAHPIVLHAAHLLDVETGRFVTPGEVLVEGERIVAVGAAVERGRGCRGHRSRRGHA